jgi:hypothetical protein
MLHVTISITDYPKFKSSTKTRCLSFVGKVSKILFQSLTQSYPKIQNKQITELEKPEGIFIFIKGTSDNHIEITSFNSTLQNLTNVKNFVNY